MKNFWTKLKKPIFCLAPMADVTDCAFRQIIAKYGKPDVFWTEFVSADGLCSAGREKLLIDLKYSKNERPIVAQIFGSKPENIRKASFLCKELGFDGIDLNMGCPDKSIEKQHSGAAMIKNPKLARECIRAAIEGGGGLPISVKTRIGYNLLDTDWIKTLLKEDLAALIVHLRTRKEMSNVPAHWDLMKRIVEIRDEMSPHRRPAGEAGKTLILGNGDVVDTDDARRKCKETGCDGVMLGRAIFGNPFLFSNKNVLSEVEGHISLDSSNASKQEASLEKHENFLLKIFSVRRRHSSQDFSPELPVSTQQKLQVMVEHTKLFEKMLGDHKNFAIMKKHYKAYANGFNGAKELRVKLMEAENASQVEKIVNDFLKLKKS
jgi:tRNA-dihydrouridine synthase